MTRLPSSLEFLQAIHHAGGTIAFDVDAIVARLGLPKRHVRKYIGGCVDRELLMEINRGDGMMLALTPAGLDAAVVREPSQPPPVVAKPSPKPPPPSSAPPPQPQATRADDDPRDRAPLDEVQRVRFGKERKMLMALTKLRDVAKVDGVDHGRFYGDAEKLGSDAKLTELEYQQLKKVLGYFPPAWPAGLTEQEARAIRRKVNLPRQAMAKARSRQAKAAEKAASVRKVGDLNPRASAIYLALAKPKTISELATGLRRHPAFLTSSGDRLGERSLKRIIQRQLDEALADRVVVTRTRHENGWEMAVFRRR
jgi:hypothetical protein